MNLFKNKTKIKFIIFILFIFLKAQNNEKENSKININQNLCKNNILDKIGLKGISNENYKIKMDSCFLNINENCCSSIDQINIINNWNYYTYPKIKLLKNKFIKNVISMKEINDNLIKLELNSLNFHYKSYKIINKKEKICYNNYNTNKWIIKINNSFSINWNSKIFNKLLIKNIKINIKKNKKLSKLDIKIILKIIYIVIKDFSNKNLLIISLGTFAHDYIIESINKIIINLITDKYFKQLSFNYEISNSEKPYQYLNNILNIKSILNNQFNILKPKFVNYIIKNQIRKFHIKSIIYFIKFKILKKFKNNFYLSNTNINKIINQIKYHIKNNSFLNIYLTILFLPDKIFYNSKIYFYINSQILNIILKSYRYVLNTNKKYLLIFKKTLVIFKNKNFYYFLKKNYLKAISLITIDKILEDIFKNKYYLDNLNKSIPNIFLKARKILWSNKSIFNLNEFGILNFKTLDLNIKNKIIEVINIVNRLNSIKIDINYNFNSLKFFYDILKYIKLNQNNLNKTNKNDNTCIVFYKKYIKTSKKYNLQKQIKCQNIYEKFKKYNFNKIISKINFIKIKLNNFLKLNKNIYCYYCSNNNKSYFDYKNYFINLSENSCINIINKYNKLFKWKILFLDKYMIILNSFLNCNSNNKNQIYINLNNKINKINIQIKILNKCLKDNKISENKYCFKFCEQIKLFSFTNQIYKDNKLINSIKINSLNILRKKFNFNTNKIINIYSKKYDIKNYFKQYIFKYNKIKFNLKNHTFKNNIYNIKYTILKNEIIKKITIYKKYNKYLNEIYLNEYIFAIKNNNKTKNNLLKVRINKNGYKINEKLYNINLNNIFKYKEFSNKNISILYKSIINSNNLIFDILINYDEESINNFNNKSILIFNNNMNLINNIILNKNDISNQNNIISKFNFKINNNIIFNIPKKQIVNFSLINYIFNLLY